MDRLVTVALRARRLLLAVWLLACLAGALFAAGLEHRIVPGGEAPASSGSARVARALAGTALPSLFVAVEAGRDAPAGELALTASAVGRAVAAVPGVATVTRLPAPPRQPGRPVDLAVLGVTTTGGVDGAISTAHRLDDARRAWPRQGLVPAGTSVLVGGFGAYRDQLTVLSRTDLQRAERVGLPIVFVVLLLSFGSLTAALLPLVIAVSALLMGLGAVGGLAHVLPMSEYVTNAASMIGLALGVDYAMFLVQRFRDAVHEGRTVDEAVGDTMRTTGTAVLWSGVTVLLAEAALLLVDSRSIRSAALGMVVVTFFAVVTALLVSPVVLTVLGPRLAGSGRGAHRLARAGAWERWARRVTGRAPLWLAGSVVLMVALAVPALHLRSSVNVSATSSMPASASVRQAYEVTAARYGPGAMSPVSVVLDHAGDAGRVPGMTGVLRGDPRVTAVSVAALPSGRPVLTVSGRAAPYGAEARSLVADLRRGPLHDRLGGSYLVGGETATGVDATHALFDSLPRVALVLLAIVAAVLFLALRSVLLPVKAVVLVILSLGSSLGSLLLLTGSHLGSRLLGIPGPTDLNPFVPVTILAIVVALSTDYEVVLLARIAEHYRVSGDNTASIVEGVARTGGVITSAAAIMIAVFLGFALADLTTLKHLGVGLALAVLIDATVVRGVMVPAAMAAMGRANWWRPRRRRPSPVAAPGAVDPATPAEAPAVHLPPPLLPPPRDGVRHPVPTAS